MTVRPLSSRSNTPASEMPALPNTASPKPMPNFPITDIPGANVKETPQASSLKRREDEVAAKERALSSMEKSLDDKLAELLRAGRELFTRLGLSSPPLFIAVGSTHFNVTNGCLALFAAWKAAGYMPSQKPKSASLYAPPERESSMLRELRAIKV